MWVSLHLFWEALMTISERIHIAVLFSKWMLGVYVSVYVSVYACVALHTVSLNVYA